MQVNNAGAPGVVVDEEALRAMDIAPSDWGVVKTTYEKAKECLHTNYYGVKKVTEALLPLLQLSTGGARIVNVSSLRSELRCPQREDAGDFPVPLRSDTSSDRPLVVTLPLPLRSDHLAGDFLSLFLFGLITATYLEGDYTMKPSSLFNDATYNMMTAYHPHSNPIDLSKLREWPDYGEVESYSHILNGNENNEACENSMEDPNIDNGMDDAGLPEFCETYVNDDDDDDDDVFADFGVLE
ncbi:hypothetical protein DM860_011442 [Cuscuta australis]|uniref:Uncharacterized protein n=1 Tax=Cuscuta australis TaxID=267555 RepID=A0A328DQB1_9ASTE|nr:hypothetical protein DM860_011442 [Cuscuta australis]